MMLSTGVFDRVGIEGGSSHRGDSEETPNLSTGWGWNVNP